MADEIERWSEELARDPASGVFIPLADALRRRGQLDLAARVATRGLSRRPYDGDAHDLLARIWADRGDVQRAMDEWSMALKCAPSHPGALKGMGFACYQTGHMVDAERYLVDAAAADPDDASIRAALARLRSQRAAVEMTPSVPDASIDAPDAPGEVSYGNETGSSVDVSGDGPWPEPDDVAGIGGFTTPSSPADDDLTVVLAPGRDAANYPSDTHPDGLSAPSPAPDVRDPRVAFDDLLGSAEQAALVVDGDGLVLAGSYVVADGRDVAQDVGAALSGVSDEARRAMRHLNLGSWISLQFETAEMTVAMAPVSSAVGTENRARSGADLVAPYRDGLALVAAGRAVPLGLVRRVLTHVVERAALWFTDGSVGGAR